MENPLFLGNPISTPKTLMNEYLNSFAFMTWDDSIQNRTAVEGPV